MPYNISTGQYDLSELMTKLQSEKKAGFELQKKKHEDWTDNYELYRGKVKTNRLTQRQAANIPLMKETIKTTLAGIDDPPLVDWNELSGNEYKEAIYQEIWNQQFKDNKLELIDVLDKKNVLLYGLSIKKLNIKDKGVDISVLDPYDVLIDPLMKNWDIESARYIVHQNIFKCLRDIVADDKYSKEGREELKIWVETPEGMIQGEKDRQAWEEKMERLKAMGINHGDFPYFAAGETIINLTEHFTKIWNGKEYERKVIVYANDRIELYNETLEDCIGVDFWPFTIWSEDPETLDIYSDSVADLVRVPNKIINVWFSQLIENRTLKNFQMHWYMPGENYTPQTYTPGPGMMLPAPPGEDVRKVIMPVEISGLDDTLDAINIITQIVERGSGATAIQKGTGEQGQQTLGEVQILVGKAQERATAMQKFYRMSWYETAVKWDGLMQANSPKSLKLYKQGKSGKMYENIVMTSDWKSDTGYEPQVRSSSEQETESIKSIQKFQFIMSQFPQNAELRKIAQKRMLEVVDLTPEELKRVEEEEDKMAQTVQQQMMMQQEQATTPNPEVMQMNERMGELQKQLTPALTNG